LSREQISDFPAASRLHATVKELNMGIPGISASTIRKITARQSEAYISSQRSAPALSSPQPPIPPAVSLPKPLEAHPSSSEVDKFMAEYHPSQPELQIFESGPTNTAILTFDRQMTEAFQAANRQPPTVRARILQELDRLFHSTDGSLVNGENYTAQLSYDSSGNFVNNYASRRGDKFWSARSYLIGIDNAEMPLNLDPIAAPRALPVPSPTSPSDFAPPSGSPYRKKNYYRQSYWYFSSPYGLDLQAPLYTPNAEGEITPTVEPALATPASPSPYNQG
jgi:hypothetical protein